MRPQLVASLKRLIYSLGPVVPIAIVVISGKRW
jgi:hypothetical protein